MKGNSRFWVEKLGERQFLKDFECRGKEFLTLFSRKWGALEGFWKRKDLLTLAEVEGECDAV